MNIDTTYHSPNFNARPASATVRALVIHSSEGTFPGDRDWLCSARSQVSAHYLVNRAGVIYRLVPESERAWHAGVSSYLGLTDWNDFSIGIECSHVAGQDWPDAQRAALAALCRDLIARYGITEPMVVAHRWIAPSRKSDPTDWPDLQLHAWIASLYLTPPPNGPYTADSPILGTSRLTETQAVRYVLSRPHGPFSDAQIAQIVHVYAALGGLLGLDWGLALAQSIHETGAFTSAWAAPPRNNPAGIGVTGAPGAGLSFADWPNYGIPAHLGRLFAYTATPEQTVTPLQQAMVSYALGVRSLPDAMRGSAPTLKQLGKAHNPTGNGWASPGTDYGARIADVANAMLGVTA